jgi:hypothetical protein
VIFICGPKISRNGGALSNYVLKFVEYGMGVDVFQRVFAFG